MIRFALGVVALTGGIMAVGAGAQPSVQVTHVREMPFALQLGPAREAARITPAQAIQAAEAAWEHSTFTRHPYTIRYGAYHSSDSRRTAAGPQPVGTIDVWAITVSGLEIQRPAGEVAQPDGGFKVVVPPDIHTDVILVDDKAGKYLESIGY